MDVLVRDEIDCALLFDHVYRALDASTLPVFLNAAFPGLDFALAISGEEGGFHLIQGKGPLFIVVSQNRRPLLAEGFRAALNSPYQQMLEPRIDEAVAAHTSNVFITVSHKPPMAELMNPEFKVSLQPAPLVELKTLVCQRLAAFISSSYAASAVFWSQSNLLFTPEPFRSIAGENLFPSLLHLHPMLFSRDENTGPRRTIGFTTLGARYVIGREILFTENPAPLQWMMQRTIAFLHMARRNDDRLIPDGESFGISAGEIIRVRHRPPNQDNVPIIELTVEKSLEQEIAAAPPPPPEPAPSPAAASPVSGGPVSRGPVFGRRRMP